MEQPNAKSHFIVSMIKSGVRILGFLALPFNIYLSAILLLIAESLGILEEMA